MTDPLPSDRPTNSNDSSDRYARLRAEIAAPYRGLRKFIYISFGASGLIGAFIFLTQILAGREVEAAFPNLALQVGVIALMVWLFRLEGRAAQREKAGKPWKK
jgi:steroid 5-alpha reductase family enzyme